MPMMPTIYDEIRNAIKRSEKSRYRMAIETGIGESQLCQFMAGNKGLSVESLEKLANCMDLAITIKPMKKRAAGKAGRKGR